MTGFADLGVRPRTLNTLERLGMREPLPVQTATIPALLAGRDAVVEAPTGSGKTLAFLVPMVERLGGPQRGGPRALIVGPTRELVSQINGVLGGLDAGLRRALLYGGVGYGAQQSALSGALDVVIGCPGRILDLAGRGLVRFDKVEYLVLDEGDEMLDAGFARDVERIIAMTPASVVGTTGRRRQTILASATMPDWVQTMVNRHLVDPHWVRVETEGEETLEHALVSVDHAMKVDTLSTLLRRHGGSAIVFHRTKHGAKKLARDLDRLGHRSAELQGNLSQNARDRAIAAFRNRSVEVLVATNVAARGIDVSHVNLVVNYELPDTPQWLTHRIGRTARNGATGRALTFLSELDADQWRKLRRLGAPDLHCADLDLLVATGELRLVARPSISDRPAPAARPQHLARPARPAANRPGAGARSGGAPGRPATRRTSPGEASRTSGAASPPNGNGRPVGTPTPPTGIGGAAGTGPSAGSADRPAGGPRGRRRGWGPERSRGPRAR